MNDPITNTVEGQITQAIDAVVSYQSKSHVYLHPQQCNSGCLAEVNISER